MMVVSMADGPGEAGRSGRSAGSRSWFFGVSVVWDAEAAGALCLHSAMLREDKKRILLLSTSARGVGWLSGSHGGQDGSRGEGCGRHVQVLQRRGQQEEQVAADMFYTWALGAKDDGRNGALCVPFKGRRRGTIFSLSKGQLNRL